MHGGLPTMLKKVSKRESVPGRVDERKSQRAIELWRIWACDGGPILARLGICSSQSDVRCVGAGASATATATALAEAINIVDTRTKKRSGFLPGCPVLALIEDDNIDVGPAAQGPYRLRRFRPMPVRDTLEEIHCSPLLPYRQR